MKRFVVALLLVFFFVPAISAQKPADDWNFADEEEDVPSWTQDIKDQALDISLFTAFATLAMVGFFRKSEWLKWITMGVAVVYLGFARSQLITIVNIFGLTEWNLPVFRHNITWYLFAIFTIVTTVLWGRIYCGRVCAFGAMTQLMDKIVPARLRFELPRRIEQKANYIKYGLLGVDGSLLRRHEGHLDLQVRRTVLDVLAAGDYRPLDRPGRIAHRDGLRQESVLPVSVPGRSISWIAVEPHRVSDQALVRMQHLQDLRKGLRMGRYTRAENHRQRMRPLRRLRTPLHGSAEVPALADPSQEESPG